MHTLLIDHACMHLAASTGAIYPLIWHSRSTCPRKVFLLFDFALLFTPRTRGVGKTRGARTLLGERVSEISVPTYIKHRPPPPLPVLWTGLLFRSAFSSRGPFFFNGATTWFFVLCILRCLRLACCTRLKVTGCFSNHNSPYALRVTRHTDKYNNSPSLRREGGYEMYIPLRLHERLSVSSSSAPLSLAVDRRSGGGPLDLSRRQFSDDGTENANIRTGVIVGVILGLFLIGIIVFLYWYRSSIRFTYRKKKGHRRSGSSNRSKSSKSSKSSDRGPPEPPPPPSPPPPEDPPPPPEE